MAPNALDRIAGWLNAASWWRLGAVIGVGALTAGVISGLSRRGPLGDTRRNGRLVRGVAYGHGETGWVEDLGNGTWRVANVPFFSPINADDVVTIVDDQDGHQTVDRVIDRVFSKKSAVYYPEPHKSNYKALLRAFACKGWKLEGGTPGMAVLAHAGREDPGSVAAGVGVGVSIESMPLRS